MRDTTWTLEEAELTKEEHDFLERCFVREVDHAVSKIGTSFLCVSPSLLTASMVEGNLIQAESATMRDALGSYEASGFSLTHTGRMLYCMTCEEEGK